MTRLPNVQEAITGAKDIIAEMVSDDAKVRDVLRTSMLKYGRIVTKEKKQHDDTMRVYQMYYDYSERVGNYPAASNHGNRPRRRRKSIAGIRYF